MSGWIGVDLDGTLARYDGWKGASHIGEPIPLMLKRVQKWVAEGRDVRIFTARIAVEEQREEAITAIHAWLRNLGLPALPVTNIKDLSMAELWDDRAVGVVFNTGLLK